MMTSLVSSVSKRPKLSKLLLLKKISLNHPLTSSFSERMGVMERSQSSMKLSSLTELTTLPLKEKITSEPKEFWFSSKERQETSSKSPSRLNLMLK
jgi:hypothetical protein